MNLLTVGAKRDEILLDILLDHLSGHFLLIDDGPLIDEYLSRTQKRATVLDFSKDSFNPLSRMDDRKADEFVAILNALYPEGESTLTRKNSNHLIFKTLVESKPRNLGRLLTTLYPLNPKDTDFKDAAQKIERLLLVNVLNNVLNTTTTFTPRGTILARINRADLGDFTSKALAWFLIARYKGQVVIPDFGFYGRPFHLSLIRQNRLIAGLNFLDEVDEDMKNALLLIEDKEIHTVTAKDAEVFADYSGNRRASEGHTSEIELAMKSRRRYGRL